MSDTAHFLALRRRVVEGYRKGTGLRWVSCLAASRIVGRHAPAQTQQLARELAVDVSAVEDMAQAGLTYRQLRPGRPELCSVRERLTYSHFAAAGALIRKFDIPPHEMVEQLRTAAEQGASVATFRATIYGEHGGPAADWMATLLKMRKQAKTLQVDYDLPKGLIKIIDKFLKQTEVYHE